MEENKSRRLNLLPYIDGAMVEFAKEQSANSENNERTQVSPIANVVLHKTQQCLQNL